MIVRRIRPETGRPNLTIMELVGGNGRTIKELAGGTAANPDG
jgi:hypothetical protein